MKFIKVITTEGLLICVNTEHIIAIIERGNRADIFVIGGLIYETQHSTKVILKKIEATP